jgi:DNA-binding response OmpR family regulator/anti-sigma regulatory factor (Ser/Thr protein kinase)
MKLELAESDLFRFFRLIVSSFSSLAEHKKIDYKVSIPETEYFTRFDPDKMEKIITNLLSNAFKFTPEQGIIEVNLYLSEKKARLVVSDTGKGIAMEKVSRIFDRFYSENIGVIEGTGIGLSLSKKLIDLHKGDIQVESETGKGATFTVILPVRKEDFEEHEILSSMTLNEYVRPELDADNITQLLGSNESEAVKSGKTMLIAEDEKELASYLVEHFPDFQTLVAENGLIAYQKAREIIPDIIISDIMMPEMDGLEFLKKTREDFLTSHIPFVLLTARTAKEHKLEGLETGADAYLEKPFDAEYLTVLVKNLLKQRKKLRQKFSGKIEQPSDAEGLNGVEKEFLDKVNGIVMAHISNPEFSVENLMEEVGMSRSQLYRKFKAISNRNPSEYIRLLRLGHAADLLREGKYTINEVAFMSGFGNVSYFNTCFKKHFGTSPGKYTF